MTPPPTMFEVHLQADDVFSTANAAAFLSSSYNSRVSKGCRNVMMVGTPQGFAARCPIGRKEGRITSGGKAIIRR